MAARRQEQFARQQAREHEKAQREALRMQTQAAREEREQYLDFQKAEAAAMTEAAASRVTSLERVLVDGLSNRPVTFAGLRKRYLPATFVPNARLTGGMPVPVWDKYQPAPSGLGRFFKSSQQKAIREARVRFEADLARQQAYERDRQARLAAARAEHDAAEVARQGKVNKHNAEVDQFEQKVRVLDPTSVEDYFEFVIEASPMPEDLPIEQTAPGERDSATLLKSRRSTRLAHDARCLRGRSQGSHRRGRDQWPRLDTKQRALLT